MALKKSDYVVERGIEKQTIKRGVRINERSSFLKAVLVKNHAKGHFHVEAKLDHNQITQDTQLDKDTVKVLGELMMVAIGMGIEFKKEWDQEHADAPDDDDQLNIGFGDGDE